MLKIYERLKWQLPAKYQRRIKKNLPVIGTLLLVIISIIVLYGLFLLGSRQLQEFNQGFQRLNDSVGKQQKQYLQDQQNLNEQLKKLQSAREAKALALAQAARTRTTRQYTSGVGCEAYRPLFASYSWNVDLAIAVCNAESGGDPNVISSTNDHGLMQLHAIPIYDPAANIAYAYNNKYLKGGWGHWSVCKNGTVNCGLV